MAIDGLLLRQLRIEIAQALPAKLLKLQQISDTELLFTLRTQTGNQKLFAQRLYSYKFHKRILYDNGGSQQLFNVVAKTD